MRLRRFLDFKLNSNLSRYAYTLYENGKRKRGRKGGKTVIKKEPPKEKKSPERYG